jgi:uncharacterized protein YbbK (DUF523 family)
MIEKVLISACLLGKKVRYGGNGMSVSERILEQWLTDGRVVSICPEVDAGMSIPRAPAEIFNGGGQRVLAGAASVIDNTGMDVSAYFIKGANMALSLCKKHNIKVTILTENSPSCGSSMIYDGSFNNNKIEGAGVTAALLASNGIKVFNQHDLKKANTALQLANDRV